MLRRAISYLGLDDDSENRQIVRHNPTSFDGRFAVAADIQDGREIILDLTRLNDQDFNRFVDFSGGLAAASKSTIEKVTNRVLMLRPGTDPRSLDDSKGELSALAHPPSKPEMYQPANAGVARLIAVSFIDGATIAVDLSQIRSTDSEPAQAVKSSIRDFAEGLTIGGGGRLTSVSPNRLVLTPSRYLNYAVNYDTIWDSVTDSTSVTAEDMQEDQPNIPVAELPDSSPKDYLGAIAMRLDQVAAARELLQEEVDAAREQGASWAAIGRVAGISYQAAQQRWSAAGRERNRRNQARRREAPQILESPDERD